MVRAETRNGPYTQRWQQFEKKSSLNIPTFGFYQNI